MVDGFTPVLGDEFHVIAYDDALWDNTEFDTYLFPALTAANLFWDIWLEADYRTDGLWLVVEGESLFKWTHTVAAEAAIPEPGIAGPAHGRVVPDPTRAAPADREITRAAARHRVRTTDSPPPATPAEGSSL